MARGSAAHLRDRLPVLETAPSGMPRRPTAEDVAECLAVLRATEGTDEEVAVALLHWFGSGAGQWSGFPCYEDLPESLLVALGTKAILAAVSKRPIDEPTLGGLARYFGSFEHRKKRRADLRSVPPELRDRMTALLEHHGDEGNIERLRSAIRFAERSQVQKAAAAADPAAPTTIAQASAVSAGSPHPASSPAASAPELVPPRAPDEATGDRRLAAIACGNHGEDQLVAWRLGATPETPGGVILALRSGPSWHVEPGHVLQIEAERWAAKNFAAINTMLFLNDGHKRRLTHFEIDVMWGGTHPDEVAAFARQVTDEAGCSVVVYEPRGGERRKE
jgi:hypothetical protein